MSEPTCSQDGVGGRISGQSLPCPDEGVPGIPREAPAISPTKQVKRVPSPGQIILSNAAKILSRIL